MAIAVTEILGTDSLSGSRLVINDNFNILASEINAIENYINPDSGVIENLNSLITENLKVGANSPVLEVNQTTFNITNSNINIGGTTGGNLYLNRGGIFKRSYNPTIIDNTLGSTADLGSNGVFPGYTVERVNNADANPLNITLYPGDLGQELIIIYAGPDIGDVIITGSSGNDIILPDGFTSISLNAIGQTVHLFSITDGIGNTDWYLIGGNGYTIF